MAKAGESASKQDSSSPPHEEIVTGPEFDWRQEEDDLKWKQKQPDRSGGKQSRRRFRFAIALFVLLLLAVSALTLFVKQDAKQREEDVLAAHGLLRQAMRDVDKELFAAMLDTEESSAVWLDMQHALFPTLYDRDFFGLEYLEDVTAATDSNVELSSDLERAIVNFEARYDVPGMALEAVPAEAPNTFPVHFQQAAVYRLDAEGRWLLTEPDEAFWGEEQEIEGRWVTLSYPERDEKIAARLAEDLDALVKQLCYELLGNCLEAELPLRLKFEGDASTWRALDDRHPLPPEFLYGIDEFVLPTPSLVGIPIDETSYRALYNTYAVHSVLRAHFHWGSARSMPSLQRLFISMGLRPWPLIAEHTTRPTHLTSTVELLCPSEQGLEQVQRYDPGTQQWHTLLSGYNIDQAYGTANGLVLWESESTSSAARLSLWENGEARLLLEEPLQGTRQWHIAELAPDGRYLALLRKNPTAQRFSIIQHFELLDLETCQSMQCPKQPLPGKPVWSPDGEHMLVTEEDDEEPPQVLLGNGSGTEFMTIAQGRDPLWIDKRTYVFRTLKREGIVVKYLNDTANQLELNREDFLSLLPANTEEALLALDSLFARDKKLLVSLMLQQMQGGRKSFYLFQFDPLMERQPTTASMKLVLSIMLSPNSYLSLSPRGDWLAVASYPDERDAYTVVLYDLRQTHEIGGEPAFSFAYPLPMPSLPRSWIFTLPALMPPPQISWAAATDGELLVISYDGILHLFSTAEASSSVLVPPTPGCFLILPLNS